MKRTMRNHGASFKAQMAFKSILMSDTILYY